MTYLDQAKLTDLLGGPSEVKANEVAEIMTQMVAKVCLLLDLFLCEEYDSAIVRCEYAAL